jgi:hypothetical protein
MDGNVISCRRRAAYPEKKENNSTKKNFGKWK